MSPEIQSEQTPVAQNPQQSGVFEKINNSVRTRLAIAGIALASAIGVSELARSNDANALPSSVPATLTAETSGKNYLSPKWVVNKFHDIYEYSESNNMRPTNVLLTPNTLLIKGSCKPRGHVALKKVLFTNNRGIGRSCSDHSYDFNYPAPIPKGHYASKVENIGSKLAETMGINSESHGIARRIATRQRTVAFRKLRFEKEIVEKAMVSYSCDENPDSNLPQIKTITLRKGKKSSIEKC